MRPRPKTTMDPFDSTALFAEFNRPRQSSDRILMNKLKGDSSRDNINVEKNGLQAENNDTSSSSESESEPDSSSEAGAVDDPKQNQNIDDNDEPVEIGRDASGSIIYRPGKQERFVGNKLLQHAGYDEEADDYNPVGDNIRKDDAKQLKLQNDTLKHQVRLIDPTSHISPTCETESPIVQILFMNNDIARKYRADIERFIYELVQQDSEEPMPSTKLRPHHVCVAQGKSKVKDGDVSLHEHRTSTVIGCSRYYKEFFVDNMGFPLVDYIPSLSYGWEIPKYDRTYTKPMPVESDSEDEDGPPKPKRSKSACFNCGGDHMLSDCKEQRNFQRIGENRRKMMEKNATANASLTKGSGRCIEDDPRFSKFKPGKYSDALLEAMGVGKNFLPPFIYKMRVLGYPPGYLYEAEIETSGIAMFDRDGKVLGRNDKNINETTLEDGEMDEDVDDNTVRFDVKKIVDFPGFNVPPAEGVIDEAYRFGFPPMMPQHSKQFMIDKLPKPNELKRQHSNDPVVHPKRQRLDVEDMDLDESAIGSSPASLSPTYWPYQIHPCTSATMWLGHNYLPMYHSSPTYALTPPRPPDEDHSSSEESGFRYQLPPPPLPPGSPPHTPPPPPLPPESPPPVTEGSSGEASPRTIPLERYLCEADIVDTKPSGTNTPTLEDLEEAQRRLLLQLAEQGDSQDAVSTPGGASSRQSSRASSVDMPPPSTPGEKPPLPRELPPETPPKPPLPDTTPPVTPAPLPNAPPPETPPNPPLPPGTPPVTPITPRMAPLTASTPVDEPSTPVTDISNSSLSRSFSASISQSLCTPVNKVNKEDLPDSDLFKKGVQEHIPYENLPEATGTYDKMKGVLANIRRLKKKSL